MQLQRAATETLDAWNDGLDHTITLKIDAFIMYICTQYKQPSQILI